MKRVVLVVLTIAIALPISLALAVSEEELDDKKKIIDELQSKLQEIQGEKQTLSKTISYLNTKVSLTENQINETEYEIEALEGDIASLSGKIDQLDVSLDSLSEILLNRVSETYKQSFTRPIYLLLTSDGLTHFFRKYKYLRVSQQHDREVMFALETARTTFDQQKQLKEEKQVEMEELQTKLRAQEVVLEQQKAEQQAALRVTENNEKTYQSQLQTALAELEAIQSIIAGGGNETEVGDVGEGETIAQIIPSASTCSNGPHLHFEVARDGVHLNPATYLSNKSVNWDNGPDSPFGFGGSWRWPIEDPIRVTQGYGMTFYAATLRYYGGAPHTGIDMMNSSGNLGIKAVKSGTLYRGGISCGGGTLRYVKVDHKDDDYESYYLHVNY